MSPRLEQWARQGARTIARNPGYLLAAAAVAGFLAGRMVKRLLSAGSGGSDERYSDRA
jgi:hypothetical protein